WLHVNGQHMLAPPPHVVMAGLTTQWALQALPVRVSLRQVLSPPPRGTHWPFTQSSWIGQSLKSKQLDGQVTGQAPGIPGGMPVSQRSEPSTTPLPHTGLQSMSVLKLQPEGQQPSLVKLQRVIALCAHWAVQVCALPTRRSVVHALPSLHCARVGHDDGGSQVSPASTTPFPQRGWQSLSLFALQLAGQQLSPPVHAVICVWVQVRWQPEPVTPSTVQALPSLHSDALCGQWPG